LPFYSLRTARTKRNMRRSRGEGSVYKRKDGLWVAQYEVGGKRRYLYRKTKKAVTDSLREKMTSRVANLAPEAEKMLLAELLNRWLPSIEGTVRQSTYTRHEEVVRLHLKPSIGRIEIKDLAPLDVEELYREKLRSGLSPPHGADHPRYPPQGAQAGL
jgi:integrase